MKVKGISKEELTECIENVNYKYGYKIIYNREPEKIGNYLNFTIRSEKSGIPGSRFSWSGRRTVSASWHAHGHLFDMILERCPDAIIWATRKKITKDGGNWQDWRCGSRLHPVMMSETSIF